MDPITQTQPQPDDDSMDLVLMKLGDIERSMNARISQAENHNGETQSDMELMQQLLVKVGSKIDEIKSLKLNMEGVEKVTIQGKQGDKGDPGDDGKNCDPNEVAQILIETDEFIAKIKGEKGDPGESIKGDKGDDGKTPVQGVDYNTAEEKKQFKSEVIDAIEVEIPNKIKKAVKEYIKMDDIVAKVNELVSKKTIKASEVEGLAEMFKTEIDKVYESVSRFSSKHGGGGSLLLAALGDVDFSNLQNGYVLKYNATEKKFYFGSGGGGGGGSTSDDVSNESTVAGTTVTDALDTLLGLINALPVIPFTPTWNLVSTDIQIDFGTTDDGIHIEPMTFNPADPIYQNIAKAYARKVQIKPLAPDHDDIDIMVENINADISDIDTDLGTFNVVVRAPFGTWGKYLFDLYLLQESA